MQFLDDLPTHLRDRFEAVSKTREVVAGEILIHRGENGTHLYVIETGTFTVVDNRSNPEIVLDILGPGAVIGEFTFVDDAPRIADVRATENGRVRVWDRTGTLAHFEADPTLAAAFYRAIARTLSARFRSVSGTVASGGFTSDRGAGQVDLDARHHASRILEAWVDADERLRVDHTDKRGQALVRAGLDHLLGEATRWLTSIVDLDERTAAGSKLSRELRPYLNRAVIAERTLDSLGQASGDPRLLAHVILGEPAGENTFGHLLDRELLALPTFQAVRDRASQMVDAGRTALVPDRPTDLLILHPNCGAVLVGLLLPMSASGGRVHVVDSNRRVLGLVDTGLPRRPPRIEFSFLQADLAGIAMGRTTLDLPPQDLIVLDGILDHLPDRLALCLLSWAARHLRVGAHLLCSGTAPTSDATIVTHVLRWPLARREPRALQQLIDSTPGLKAQCVSGDAAGVVIQATRTPTG